MNYRAKVILVNLGILVAIAVITFFASDLDSAKGGAILFGLVMVTVSVLQFIVLIITGAVLRTRDAKSGRGEQRLKPTEVLDHFATEQNQPRGRGEAFLLAALLVLLIGGSLCYGSLTL